MHTKLWKVATCLLCFVCCKPDENMPGADQSALNFIQVSVKDNNKQGVLTDSVKYVSYTHAAIISPPEIILIYLNTTADSGSYFFYTTHKTDTLTIFSRRVASPDGSSIKVTPYKFVSTFNSFDKDTFTSLTHYYVTVLR